MSLKIHQEKDYSLKRTIEIPVNQSMSRQYTTTHDQSSPFIQDSINNDCKRKNLDWIYRVILVTLFILLSSTFLISFNSHDSPFIPSKITRQTFDAGVSQCNRIKSLHSKKPAIPRESNPRFSLLSHSSSYSPNYSQSYSSTHSAFLLQHATLLNGDGQIQQNTDILVIEGLIKNITSNMNINNMAKLYNLRYEDIHVIDVKHKFITPGLVDMHSHAGTDSWPGLDASDDTNEMTSSPTTPYLRSIDGFNPKDPAIQIINAGGITTSLILPGSGNLIGGEAFVIKHRLVKSNKVADMMLYANANEKTEGIFWRHIKMACGENAKDVYGPKGMMPGSRMGEGFLFREQFSKAKDLKDEQDAWCSLQDDAIKARGKQAIKFIHKSFPNDIKLDSLVALLRDEVKLQNHCYETEDLEMMIRHSHEYGYKIQAFHHALEAWRVADMIHYENISTALFADNWGYKKEAYESSVHAAELLTAAGVKVAFKSDHPVLNAQAHFYGLDAKSAIKSVTSISAENIGATHRIGSVAPGYDADLVIWNTHPLILGATPLRVFVDGYETFRHPTHDAIMKDAMHDNEEKVESYEEVKNLNFECMDSSSRNVVLTNISSIYASESVHLVGSLRIIIADGIIECFGSDSDCHASTTTHQINMQRGVIIPGLVLGMSHLGLEEITSEQRTSNGVSRVDVLKSGGTRAADGLRVGLDGSKVQKSAYFGGVTRSVSVPRGSGVVLGQATHFILGVDDLQKAIIDQVTGVSVVIGNEAKEEGIAGSVAGQIGILRSILVESIDRVYKQNKSETIFDRVIACSSVLYVHVQESNDIQRVLQLKGDIESMIDELHPHQKLSVTLVGGAEAWKLSKKISEAQVNVMLMPSRCTPTSWESRSCLLPNGIGSGLDFINNKTTGAYYPAAQQLMDAGIKVALGIEEDGFARGLIWEAGWVYQESKSASLVLGNQMSAHKALGLVTWNVADVLGMKSGGRIVVGQRADLLGYNYDPIEGYAKMGGLYSHLKLIVNGQNVECNPRQV